MRIQQTLRLTVLLMLPAMSPGARVGSNVLDKTSGVTLIVNGIEANGPGVTPSAVQEVKINQNSYPAFAFSNSTANLILTSGGNPCERAGEVCVDLAKHAKIGILVTKSTGPKREPRAGSVPARGPVLSYWRSRELRRPIAIRACGTAPE